MANFTLRVNGTAKTVDVAADTLEAQVPKQALMRAGIPIAPPEESKATPSGKSPAGRGVGSASAAGAAVGAGILAGGSPTASGVPSDSSGAVRSHREGIKNPLRDRGAKKKKKGGQADAFVYDEKHAYGF